MSVNIASYSEIVAAYGRKTPDDDDFLAILEELFASPAAETPILQALDKTVNLPVSISGSSDKAQSPSPQGFATRPATPKSDPAKTPPLVRGITPQTITPSSTPSSTPINPSKPWRRILIEEHVELLHEALPQFGTAHAFSLNLGKATEADARQQKHVAGWLQKRIAKNLKDAFGPNRDVQFWFALEETSAGRLHLHGEIAVTAEELTVVEAALRKAGGKWSNRLGSERQVDIKPVRDRRWLPYVLKTFDNLRGSKALGGQLWAATKQLKAAAKDLFHCRLEETKVTNDLSLQETCDNAHKPIAVPSSLNHTSRVNTNPCGDGSALSRSRNLFLTHRSPRRSRDRLHSLPGDQGDDRPREDHARAWRSRGHLARPI